MTRPWGTWTGPATFAREGEVGKPGEQIETREERLARESARAKRQEQARGTLGPTSPEGPTRGPGPGTKAGSGSPAPRPPEATSQGPAREAPPPAEVQRLTRKTVREWLIGTLSERPVLLADIYQAADGARVRRALIREARLALPIVEYPTPEGEVWMLLRDGYCIGCGAPLYCQGCGQHAMLPPGIEPTWDLAAVAAWCRMKPSSLRAWLSRHRDEFPARYRRGKGGRLIRAITLEEYKRIWDRSHLVREYRKVQKGR